MNNIAGVFIFIVGVAVGSVATFTVVKKKYEDILEDEIYSVKETFRRREDKNVSQTYEDIVEGEKYVITQEADVSSPKKEKRTVDMPYMIPPEEFGETYDTVCFTYYGGDGVLVDECGEPVEDIEKSVGKKALKSFGEYDDDCIFVRNDRLCLEYEVNLDFRKYSEVMKRKPHERE